MVGGSPDMGGEGRKPVVDDMTDGDCGIGLVGRGRGWVKGGKRWVTICGGEEEEV